MAINIKTLPDEELLYGSKGCQGCCAILASRLAMKIIGENSILLTPACCFAAVVPTYPQIATFVNLGVTAFPALASTMSGAVAAREIMPDWEKDVTIVGFAGDGGTVDIGLQALSGACERNDDMIYICYDNEAYMNTGVQRSGATPYHSWTTTTPTGTCSKGENTPFKKNLFEILAAHRVPYAATASTSYPMDFMEKVRKAKGMKGIKIIHVMAPCPTGWGFDPKRAIEIGRLAVESGLWYLAEYENETFALNYEPKAFKPVSEYCSGQRRFKHLTEEDFSEIEKNRDIEWVRLRKRLSEK